VSTGGGGGVGVGGGPPHADIMLAINAPTISKKISLLMSLFLPEGDQFICFYHIERIYQAS